MRTVNNYYFSSIIGKLGHSIIFYRNPPPPPLRMASFCRGGFGFFLQRGRQNLDPSDFFFKVPTKNKPFGFHFSKGVDNKLRVRIPAILRGGGGCG